MKTKNSVIIIAEDTKYWPIHRRGNFLAKNMKKSTADAEYVAVYQSRPVSAITHYGRITAIRDDVPYREIYARTQFGTRKGSAKVYEVEEFIELPHRVEFDRKKDGSAIRSFMYCALDDLFSSNSLRDIREAKKQRKANLLMASKSQR